MSIKWSSFTSAGELKVGNQVVGLTSGNSNARFDFPGTGIKDASGNYIFRYLPAAGTAANYLTINSALTGDPVLLASTGSDTNVDLQLSAKGNGSIILMSGLAGEVSINSTSAVKMPAGTTAQRPVGVAGDMRYNTTLTSFEFYDTGLGDWNQFSSGSGVDSVTGTANRIVITGGPTTPVVNISVNYVGQTSITTLGTVTTGTWSATTLDVAHGGTSLTATTPYSVLCGGVTTTSALQSVTGLGTSGQILTSNGAGALPTWQNAGSGGVTSVGGTLNRITSSGGTTPVIDIDAAYVGQTSITTLGTIAAGTWNANIISGQYGGTGVANTGKTITLGGNLTTSGAFNSVFTMTAGTAVTFPTTGTLATTTDLITVNHGGTGATTFTAYSVICAGTTSTGAFQNVSGLGSAGQVLTSAGAGALPVWQATTFSQAGLCQGRLTLTSSTPVTTANVTAATTIYFTPYKGNGLSLFNGSSWTIYSFSQLNAPVPAAANQMYDIFVYDNASVLTLDLVAWTNDSTRAVAIVYQDGVYCKSGALGRRYLGSMRTTSVSGQTESSNLKRYVYNYYNRIPAEMNVTEATASWNYTLATFRQANGSTANQVEFVAGVIEDPLFVNVRAAVTKSSGSAAAAVGVGINSTSVNSAIIFGSGVSGTSISSIAALYQGTGFSLGRNYIAWLEFANATNTATWYGSGIGLTAVNSGTGLIANINL